MRFDVLATEACGSSSCPTVYEMDEENVVVQGYRLSEKPGGIPTTEEVVKVPKSLLKKLIGQL